MYISTNITVFNKEEKRVLM